jgi:hypothetical protein
VDVQELEPDVNRFLRGTNRVEDESAELSIVADAAAVARPAGIA